MKVGHMGLNMRGRLRPTLQARLTLIYGGLFLAAGVVVLGATYALLEHRLPKAQMVTFSSTVSPPGAPGAKAGVMIKSDQLPPIRVGGETVAPEDVPDYLFKREAELRSATLRSLLTQGAIALVVVAAAAIGLGWLLAGRVLAPLRRVTETARRVAHAPAAGRGLHERLALNGPNDEVKELADAFDTMLQRLDHSFDGQRRFVANASHELRTPLTLNRSLVEVAMRRKTASPDVRQLGEVLLEVNTRHERLINGLLLLARSENESIDRSPVDLADVAAHVASQSAAEATEAGVDLQITAGSAGTCGDPVLLERLVQNLVDNAIRHNTPAAGRVRIWTGMGPDGRACLVVTNTGPVVPPYEIPSLFEPFRRFTGDRLATSRGAGLGLSIVRAVAHAHGGEVLASPAEGGGLTVTVALPAGPVPAPPIPAPPVPAPPVPAPPVPVPPVPARVPTVV
jgi:signal transduction histidine kinase